MRSFLLSGVSALLGLAVGVAADVDPCLSVVTMSPQNVPGGMILIDNGVVNKNWDRHVFEDDVVFDFFLSNTCDNDTQAVTDVKVQNENTGFLQIEMNYTTTSNVARKFDTTTTQQGMQVLVHFKCRIVESSQFYTFNMSFTPEGYNETSFEWIKVCLPPKPMSPDDGNWTAAGVFFFVVFLITLVCCFAGCGYNYTVKGETGPQIIPCYLRFLGCVQGMGSKPTNRTPQMNYDDTSLADSGADYGAAYQTDL